MSSCWARPERPSVLHPALSGGGVWPLLLRNPEGCKVMDFFWLLFLRRGACPTNMMCLVTQCQQLVCESRARQAVSNIPSGWSCQ